METRWDSETKGLITDALMAMAADVREPFRQLVECTSSRYLVHQHHTHGSPEQGLLDQFESKLARGIPDLASIKNKTKKSKEHQRDKSHQGMYVFRRGQCLSEPPVQSWGCSASVLALHDHAGGAAGHSHSLVKE